MLIRRLLAQALDLLCGVLLLLGCFLFLLPWLLASGMTPAMAGVLLTMLFLALCFLIQLPFWAVHQTVGKAFFGLKMVSTDSTRPLTISIIFQREVFCKLVTCYLLCIPMLAGQPGGHEVATKTAVETIPSRKRRT